MWDSQTVKSTMYVHVANAPVIQREEDKDGHSAIDKDCAGKARLDASCRCKHEEEQCTRGERGDAYLGQQHID